MAFPIGMALGALALGAIPSYILKKGEVSREQEKTSQEGFLRTAQMSAVVGETTFFDRPETQKAFKKFGAEEMGNALAALAKSPLTQEQRTTLMTGLLAQQEQSKAGAAAGKTEQGRQQVFGTAIQGLQKTVERAGEVGKSPMEALQEQITRSPEATAAALSPPAGQIAGAQRATETQQTGETQRTGMTTATQLQVASMQRQTALEVKAIEAKSDAERTGIMREQVNIDRARLAQTDREFGAKVAASLFGEGLTVGESKAASNYFAGKTNTISDTILNKAGFNRNEATAIKAITDQALDLEKQGTRLIDDLIGLKTDKKKTALSTQETISRVDQSNRLILQSVQLLVQHKLISPQQAQQELAAKLRLMTDKGDLVSPTVAASMGLKTINSLPEGLGSAPGSTTTLSPTGRKLLEEFLQK